MIDGLSHLTTMRRAGLVPKSVWLSVGGQYLRPKYAQEQVRIELIAHDSVALDDFRVFKGLQVRFYAGEWSQLASDALEKLKAYAEEITVLVADYGDDIGYFWSREHGSTEMRFL